MKNAILTIGELLADFVSAEYVQSIAHGKNFKLQPGGSPANVCANLRWMNVDASLVSCVGDDALGHYLIDYLKEIGICTRHISVSRQLPTSMVIVGRSRGTPDFIAYRTADTQIGEVDRGLIEQSAIVHTCAFALSRNPAQHNILNALSTAVSLSKTVSVDWNYVSSMWESDGRLAFQKILSMRPLLKVSLDDIQRFSGEDLSIEEAKMFLSASSARVTCLTCGKNGVWFKADETPDWKFCPATPVADVIDTTGAGDAFWAAFLAAWVGGEPVANCVQRGVEIAARKISQHGPLYRTR